ncbi:MAG TPA: Hsp20/alpha crystallin family protein, partial [Gammaproteobacteria bacterium]|nr:Hsp20/alpha crystallin family protein [Gammaproteobacteria bacterium]
MNITRYQSRDLLRDLSNQMDRFLNDPFGAVYPGDPQFYADGWSPAVDIKEEADRFVVHADLPGVDAKDIDVSLENGVLSISGKRESEVKDVKDGYRRVECSYGEFRRQFTLPETADADKVTAKSDKG